MGNCLRWPALLVRFVRLHHPGAESSVLWLAMCSALMGGVRSHDGIVTGMWSDASERVSVRDAPISYARHPFPPVVIIQHAVWLYLRFALSYRDVEELLAERGLDVSYETVRRWVLKFGPQFARRLRARRPRPSSQLHLDEMVAAIGGKRLWLWRAIDSEGEILPVP
jgi:hypothetical protein